MTWITVIKLDTGRMKFFGPFPSQRRADEYATAAIKADVTMISYTSQELVVPYAVVSNIIWR